VRSGTPNTYRQGGTLPPNEGLAVGGGDGEGGYGAWGGGCWDLLGAWMAIQMMGVISRGGGSWTGRS